MKTETSIAGEPEVVMVPVASVRITNPREREGGKFDQIVKSIASAGLKRPITVTEGEPSTDGQPAYDLVCGQGRLQAFIALGQTHIPAIVRRMSKNEGMLASLVENIARRRVPAVEQIKLIQWMQKQGNTVENIAQKTGLSLHYLQGVLNLINKGEERILNAVLQGRLPISIATQIATMDDAGAQHLLMEAYEKKDMTQSSLSTFRRLLEQRRCFGKSYADDTKTRARRRTTAEGLVAAYKKETQLQGLLVEKAEACETRLLSIVAAFKALFADENFITLLRAEDLDTLPKFLAGHIHQP